MKPFLWTHVALSVPGFRGTTDVDLPVPCTYDFDVAGAKYLHSVGDGEVPLMFLFSGTVFSQGSAGLEAVNAYVIAIQFGAILAVAALFGRRFVEMVQGIAGRNPEGRQLFVALVIAFVPSAVLGALFDVLADRVEQAAGGCRGRQPERVAELTVEVATAERGVVAIR